MAKIVSYSVKIRERGVYLGKTKATRVWGGYEIRIPASLWRFSATGKLELYPSRLFLLFHRGMTVRIRMGEEERTESLRERMLWRI